MPSSEPRTHVERHEPATRTSPHLRVHLFGVPRLEFDGSTHSFTRRPLCAVLLAMLLMGGPDRRISRRAIAADLWPDDTESAAASNLRRHLSFLVKTLGSAATIVGRDRADLWWHAAGALWCDVVAFERGDLELYEAEFIADSPHYWVAAQRERLRDLAVTGWLRQAGERRELDDYDAAIAAARRATKIDPWNESVAALEIELHGERGDIPALDRAFADLQRHLREVEIEPTPETLALVERFHTLAREAAARLPRPQTSFVESERIDDLANVVAEHRLVTITGPGGVGKTRLALEAAHRLASSFPDGAYFADLSTIEEGDALSDALSRTFGVPSHLVANGFAGIFAFLRNRRALIVLDNCEQIVESCSWFVSDLMQAAPHVRIVATSREAFGLRAERRHVVRPLSPAAAERLFADRGRDASGDALEGDAATARIGAICRRLDRLPLALELAAAMLGALSLADVEVALEKGLDRLRSRDATAPDRHRSLHDVIDWSVRLLDDRERAAFARLAVFSGPFSAADASVVCAVHAATLAKLAGASILVREHALESRFTFLISIGEAAHKLFEADPGATMLRHAHAARYADIAMRSQDPAFWPSERAWLDEIKHDFANFVQALKWTLFEDGRTGDAVRLAVGLTHYFLLCGFLGDGISWLSAAYGRTEPETVDRARVAHRLALLEHNRGNFETARTLAHESAAILEGSGYDADLARALRNEAYALVMLGRSEEAVGLLERSLELTRSGHDRRFESLVLATLGNALESTQPARSRDCYVLALRRSTEAGAEIDSCTHAVCVASCDYVAERYDDARQQLESALARQRTAGLSSMIGATLYCLGDVAFMQGSISLARERYAEALDFYDDADEMITFPPLITGISGVALHVGRPRDAARLIGAARWERFGIRSPAEMRVLVEVRAQAMLVLGEEEFECERIRGRDLAREEAIAVARSVLRSRV